MDEKNVGYDSLGVQAEEESPSTGLQTVLTVNTCFNECNEKVTILVIHIWKQMESIFDTL